VTHDNNPETNAPDKGQSGRMKTQEHSRFGKSTYVAITGVEMVTVILSFLRSYAKYTGAGVQLYPRRPALQKLSGC